MKGNGCVAICIACMLLLCTMFLPVYRSTGVPHAIIGNVMDLDGRRVTGVFVWVNNTATGDSLSCVTDYLGRYSVDIDSYPSGYAAGQILDVTASYDNYTAAGNITVNTEPVQQLPDLILAFRNHIITGRVLKPNGADAIHFAVNILNLDTNVSRNCTTDSYGHYRIDIGLYPGAYNISDNICASVDAQGFQGSNYCAVSTNQTDFINVTLADVQAPTLSISYAPVNVTIGQYYRLVVNAVDNLAVAWVRLHMRMPGQTLFTQYLMHVDDGVIYDWNGDHWLNPTLFGISTSDTLPIQTTPGTAEYYFTASDSLFTTSLPSTDPQANPFELAVLDVTPPVLTHTPITQLESGQPGAVTTLATDNVAVSGVVLNYRQSGASSFTQAQMSFTGNPNEFGVTVPAQMYLGTMEYFITCNDTSNNSARLPVVGQYAVAVQDTTPPAVAHTLLNSANVGQPINFTCQASDIWLSDVWLNFTDVHGSEFNFSMLPSGPFRYHLNASGQDATGILHYTLWANDTSGNIQRVSHSMAINDIGTPTVFHAPPGHLDFNVSETLVAYVEDDVNIAGVTLAYRSPGASSFTMMGMISADSDGKHGNFTADIPAQTTLGMLDYYINATDGTNNISWPALAPYFSVQILDLEPPELSDLTFLGLHPADTQSITGAMCPFTQSATIRINVTDNRQVGTVSLMWLNTTGTAWLQTPMADAAADMYEATLSVTKPDTVRFFVLAEDASGNNQTYPSVQPKLNYCYIEFYNDTAPGIATYAEAGIGVNETSDLFVDVIGLRDGMEVQLLCKGTQSTTFVELQLTLLQNGSYISTVPAQNRSGSVQYYALIREGMTVHNQTSVANISVVNSLPIITHVSVPTAPVSEPIALAALVTDDLHVESVTLNWKLEGQTQFSTAQMVRTGMEVYTADITQQEPVVIQYYITASDAEGQTRYPDLLELEISVTDMERPSIIHTPLSGLTDNELPIIIATVTDNRHVETVTLFFRNSSASSFSQNTMGQASGSDDYIALLGRQPDGNFSYYIVATDGVNEARCPSNGTFLVDVEHTGSSDWLSWVLMGVAIALTAVAALLMALRFRRKPIKQEPVSPPNRMESDEDSG